MWVIKTLGVGENAKRKEVGKASNDLKSPGSLAKQARGRGGLVGRG